MITDTAGIGVGEPSVRRARPQVLRRQPWIDSKPANEQTGHAEADKQLDAIAAILNKSKTGTLTKAQTARAEEARGAAPHAARPEQVARAFDFGGSPGSLTRGSFCTPAGKTDWARFPYRQFLA